MTHDKGRALSRFLLVLSTGALALSLAGIDSAFDKVDQYYFGQIANRDDRPINNAGQLFVPTANETRKTGEQVDNTARETLAPASGAVDDTVLAAKVKAALIGARSLDSSKIHIGATDGVVTLSGTTETAMKRDFAEQLALSVEGVAAVRNEITIPRLMSGRMERYAEIM